MDRIIEKKRWTKKKILTIGAIATFLIMCISIWLSTGTSKLNVDAERMTIGEVRYGKFQEFIPINGIVMPLTTIYLDILEGGRVEELYVEDGAIVKQGDPIIRLSNTNLELSLVNQETAVYNLITQMQISQNSAQQNTDSRLNQLTEAENDFIEAKRVYDLNKQLYEVDAISRQEFLQIDNTYKRMISRFELAKKNVKQDSIISNQQLEQSARSLQGAQRSLELMQRKVNDLVVRAPIDGRLTSLDAEIGQSKNSGQRIGQVDVSDGYKLRAEIDEHYIARVYAGLKGEYKVGGEAYALTVKKVYTQVANGRFSVDLMFDDTVPRGIRRGQSLQVRLALSDETEALLLPRGGFYQQTGGNWVFKVDGSGSKAYKVNIRIGRQNPDYYEVLEGLEQGDKVVVNGYENYGDVQELVIKK
ncbi:MAG: efflux RND transporter periplasmic adaptor subunit [Prevotellaceae bacterium]|jgi:HlyD family secretion protein|nr:efflux RND transporter periplasmic adaptor subunit [Prevotellaceae bacterium]